MAVLDKLVANIRYSQIKPYIKFLERKKRNLLILDAGGASGTLHIWLKKRKHNVIVLDKTLKANICADLNEGIPFRDKSFDLVICLAVLEHLMKWKHALQELKRVGHHVILTTPTPAAKPFLELLAKLQLINREHIEDHKYYLKKDDIEKEGYKTKTFLLGLNRIGLYNLDFIK